MRKGSGRAGEGRREIPAAGLAAVATVGAGLLGAEEGAAEGASLGDAEEGAGLGDAEEGAGLSAEEGAGLSAAEGAGLIEEGEGVGAGVGVGVGVGAGFGAAAAGEGAAAVSFMCCLHLNFPSVNYTLINCYTLEINILFDYKNKINQYEQKDDIPMRKTLARVRGTPHVAQRKQPL